MAHVVSCTVTIPSSTPTRPSHTLTLPLIEWESSVRSGYQILWHQLNRVKMESSVVSVVQELFAILGLCHAPWSQNHLRPLSYSRRNMALSFFLSLDGHHAIRLNICRTLLPHSSIKMKNLVISFHFLALYCSCKISDADLRTGCPKKVCETHDDTMGTTYFVYHIFRGIPRNDHSLTSA